MNTALIFQIQSGLILSLMFLGVYLKRNRLAHIRIMASAIVWDVILILQIELSRGAIEKASNAITNKMMLNIHISFAVLSVLFYVAMVISGRKLLKGNNGIRPLHKKLGYTTLFLRLATFVTSFWAVSK